MIDGRPRIGDEVYIHGYIDEIRKDVIIIRNEGGYFGTVPSEMFYYEEDSNGYGTMNEADTPLTDCETCKYGQDKHRYAHICNECGVGINNYTPQTETQNSNKNSNVILVDDEVGAAVRCAMCSNPNKSDRGCDGACSYDEKLYERIMKAIAESVVDTPQNERSE